MAEYIKRTDVMKICEGYSQHCFHSNDSNGQDIADRILDDVVETSTADVVEVETIKAWLYEIAINNVGCDGDFSNACEEIIARIDGLRNFAKERSEGDG